MKRVPPSLLSLTYLDPEEVLREMRQLERSLPLDSLPYSVRALRTNQLKHTREVRQAALFCYGMSRRLGTVVRFADIEAQDYDFIATYEQDGEQKFVRVQLKELVPDDMPFRYKPISLQEEIAKLDKYVDSQNLIVAFHLNRQMSLQVDKLTLPAGRLAQLWFFGGADAFQSRWFLIGDLLAEGVVKTEFDYPGLEITPFTGYTIQFCQ